MNTIHDSSSLTGYTTEPTFREEKLLMHFGEGITTIADLFNDLFKICSGFDLHKFVVLEAYKLNLIDVSNRTWTKHNQMQ